MRLRLLCAVLLANLMAVLAHAGTVTGSIQRPNGQPLANGVVTFSLSQAGVTQAGSITVTSDNVYCGTSSTGSVVGITDPAVPAALSANYGAGTLPAAQYFVQFTYSTGAGESAPSPETTFLMTSSGTLNGNAPLLQPGNATGYKVYIGTTSGGETLQQTVVGFAGWSQPVTLVAGAAPPVSNSTLCNTLIFNDAITPSYTTYLVNLLDSKGKQVAGYPQRYYFSGATLDLSTLAPAANLYARFPTAIVAQPGGNGLQSIAGPLSLGAYPLTAGPISVGPITGNTLNNIVLVGGTTYTCSDAGIAAALAAAQNTNGIVDARGCPAMSWTSNPFLGLTKPVTLLLGGVTISHTKTLAASTTNRVGPVKILCSGTTLDFEPTGPFLAGINDRAIMFDWGEPAEPAHQAVSGALAVGASTITSTSAPSPAPVAGQWIEVVEIDTGVNDAVAFAYVQVASVAGSVITLQRPLNVSFPNNTGAGNTWYGVLVNLLPDGDTIEGCQIRSSQAGSGTPGVAVMHVRNALVSNNDIAMANGQDIYSYRSDASTFRGNKLSAVGVNPANSEMAESTNLIVSNNHFVAEGVGPVPGLSVDFGSNHFLVSTNTFDGIGGIQLFAYNGASNGVISNNTFGYVNGGNGQAIQLQSVLNTTISNNVLAGGSSTGIGISNSVPLAVTLASAGNIVYGNTLGTYSPNYSLTAGSVVAPIDNGLPFRQTVGSGTSTSNGTAIGSGVSQAQPAITITGATTTDVATCSLNAAPVATWQTGIQFLLPVVTANTVTPWLSNPTAGSITPVAAVIRCSVSR